MEFKDRLVELRKEFGYTQEELGNKIGMSKTGIGGYEQGKRKPDLNKLEEISDVFNVDIDYLLGKSDVKRKVSLDDYREQYSMQILFGKMSKECSDLDVRIFKKYAEMSISQKEKLEKMIDLIINN